MYNKYTTTCGVNDGQGCSGAETRWNAVPANIVANHVVLVRLTLDQFIFWPKLPPNAGFCIKNLRKKISGGDTPEPPQREGGDPLPHSLPARLQAVRGAQAPPLLGPRSRKPFPKIKIYHYTPDDGTPTPCQAVLVCSLCLAVLTYSGLQISRTYFPARLW